MHPGVARMFRVSVALLAALPATIAFMSDASAQSYRGTHAPIAVSSSRPLPAIVSPPPRIEVVRPNPGFVLVPIIQPGLIGPPVSLAPSRSQTASVRQFRDASRPIAIRPLSVNPIDPFTVVSRTPSGRVVLSSLRSGAVHHGHRHQARGHMPYAPPSFQIIGASAGKNMSQPVRLTHGTQPRRGLRTEPRVVFLKDAR